MFGQTGARPRRSWILLALILLLGVAVSALFGILAPGILSDNLWASERLALPRIGAVVGAKAAGRSHRAVRQAASANPSSVTPRCGALPEPIPGPWAGGGESVAIQQHALQQDHHQST